MSRPSQEARELGLQRTAPEDENSLVLCMRFTRMPRTASMQSVRCQHWEVEACGVHEEDPGGLSRAPQHLPWSFHSLVGKTPLCPPGPSPHLSFRLSGI